MPRFTGAVSRQKLGEEVDQEQFKPQPMKEAPAELMGKAEPVRAMGEPMKGMQDEVPTYGGASGNINRTMPVRDYSLGMRDGMARDTASLGGVSNPWQNGQLDASRFIPEWAKPKQQMAPPDPKPAEKPAFKEIAGFQDYDPAMMGDFASAGSMLSKEAAARGFDMSKINPNDIATRAGIDINSGKLNGEQYNKVRRLLFS